MSMLTEWIAPKIRITTSLDLSIKNTLPDINPSARYGSTLQNH